MTPKKDNEETKQQVDEFALGRSVFDPVYKKVVNPLTGNKEDEFVGYIPNYLNFTKILENIFHPITFKNSVYIYNEETQLYKENEGEIQKWVQKAAESISWKHKAEDIKHEVYGRMRDSNIVDRYPFNQFAGFPVGNGVVVFREDMTLGLIPYDWTMKFTRKIQTNYNPKADTSLSEKVINTWIDNERDRLILYQIPAQAIIQSLPGREPSKKAYLIMGQSNGGKSSYIALLERVFDKETNFSSVSLQTMGNNQDMFWQSTMVGKLFNVCDDLQAIPLKSTENFKAITGKRTHQVNPKGKQPYIADITTVCVYTCNKPPEIRGEAKFDDAFWGRWEYTVFPYTFDKIDGWTDDTFTAAFLEGYLLVILEYAAAMLQIKKLMIRSEAADVKDRWMTDSNPLAQFIEENCDIGNDSDKIPTAEFLNQLFAWRDDKDGISEADYNQRYQRLPHSQTALTQIMLHHGHDTRTITTKGNRQKYYMGIRWKAGAKYAKIETKNAHL